MNIQAAGLVALSAFFWGLWWMPLRWLETRGVDGVSASVAMNLGGAAALGCVCLFLPRSRARLSGNAHFAAIVAGVAIGLYGVAVVKTDVTRAILLFYLAPAWSLLFEIALIGRKPRWALAVPVGCGVLALFCALRFKFNLAGFNLGDFAALFSGMAWAFGAALFFRAKVYDPIPATAMALLASGVAALLFVSAPATLVDQMGTHRLEAFYALLIGACFLGPIVWITLWGAARLSPVTICLILTFELFSGLGSAALFLGEPFGIYEFVGLILIALAVGLQLRQSEE